MLARNRPDVIVQSNAGCRRQNRGKENKENSALRTLNSAVWRKS
jgi:hypothetical protein